MGIETFAISCLRTPPFFVCLILGCSEPLKYGICPWEKSLVWWTHSISAPRLCGKANPSAHPAAEASPCVILSSCSSWRMQIYSCGAIFCSVFQVYPTWAPPGPAVRSPANPPDVPPPKLLQTVLKHWRNGLKPHDAWSCPPGPAAGYGVWPSWSAASPQESWQPYSWHGQLNSLCNSNSSPSHIAFYWRALRILDSFVFSPCEKWTALHF